jgi:hypothetical protein
MALHRWVLARREESRFELYAYSAGVGFFMIRQHVPGAFIEFERVARVVAVVFGTSAGPILLPAPMPAIDHEGKVWQRNASCVSHKCS